MLLGQVIVPSAIAFALLLASSLALVSLRRQPPRGVSGDAGRRIAEGTATLSILLYSGALVVGLLAAAVAGAALGILRSSPEEGGLTALALAAGALASTASGLGGTLAGARAVVTATPGSGRSARGTARTVVAGAAPLGLMPAALSLAGVAGLFALYTRVLGHGTEESALLISPFALGASTVALLAQLGGGVYAEASELGNALLPEVDGNISRGDLRNAAVIASPVGNLARGSLARGADIFDGLSAGTLCSLILGAGLYAVSGEVGWLLLPLVTAALGLLASGAGLLTALGAVSRTADLVRAARVGLWTTAALSGGGLAAAAYLLVADGWLWIFLCGMLGLSAGLLIVHMTRFYTQGIGPAGRDIAQASEIGTAPKLIMSSAVGLEAAAAAGLALTIVVGGAFFLGQQAAPAGVGHVAAGLFGVTIGTVGMLMTGAFVAALSSLGAVAASSAAAGDLGDVANEHDDGANFLRPAALSVGREAGAYSAAAGILAVAVLLFAFLFAVRVELARVAADDPLRFVMLSQDLGALPSGIDVEAGATNALIDYHSALESCDLGEDMLVRLLVADRPETSGRLAGAGSPPPERSVCAAAANGSPVALSRPLAFGLARPEALAGAVLGMVLALLCSSLVLRSVWKAAGQLVGEVRRQFRDEADVVSGEAPADSARAVSVVARSALRSTVRPGVLTVCLLVGGGVVFRFASGETGNGGWLAVAGLLAGMLVGGAMLGAYLGLTGAALDSGKRALEENASHDEQERIGARAHAPARVAAAAQLGRPLRGAAGPAVTVIARTLGTAALVLVPLFVG